MAHQGHHDMPAVSAVPFEKTKPLLRVLADCRAACEDCSARSYEAGIDCARHCAQCVAILNATMSFVALNNADKKTVADVCAKTCGECAEMCKNHDNPHCQECRKTCLAVVEELKKL